MASLIKSRRDRITPWANPFERFFRNDFPDLWNGNGNPETIPSVNIREEKDRYSIELAAPGLKKEDFTIDLDGNTLTISGETKSESEEGKEDEGYMRREYNYSHFSRSMVLPDAADIEKVEAKYSDGILCVTVPKKAEKQKNNSRKIKVG